MERQRSVDVVVAGSGAAALAAALAAAHRGLSVLVLEKSEWLGGTSAMSGAGTWIPANHHAAAAGIEDSPREALDYLRAVSPEGWREVEDELWQAFAETAPEMLRFLEAETPLRFELIAEPDPMSEAEGGKPFGRMLSPKPLSRNVAGPLGRRIRRSTLPHILSYGELMEHDLYGEPIRTILAMGPTLLRRLVTRERGQGSALVAGLLRGCLDAGVEILTRAPVTSLVQDETGAVVGVVAETPDEILRIATRKGVVLATGGFEWDAAMRERHFQGGIERLGSPDTNSGDGQRLARAAGARLERMDQANIYPTLPTFYEGRVHGLPLTFQASPHAIVVNGAARRFCSELDFNIGERLDERGADGRPLNSPAFVIADRRFVSGAFAFRLYAARQKGWLVQAPDLASLADRIGLPSAALLDTVARWNGFCRAGRDADFRRGENAWERYKAGLGETDDVGSALGPIEQGPFYAMSFDRSILGTKGGARTDRHGRVLREDGGVIAGLFCAGNAMANPIGTRAVGPGTTIGPCLTWGYICGNALAAQN